MNHYLHYFKAKPLIVYALIRNQYSRIPSRNHENNYCGLWQHYQEPAAKACDCFIYSRELPGPPSNMTMLQCFLNREQRVTGTMVFLLVGLSVKLAPILKVNHLIFLFKFLDFFTGLLFSKFCRMKHCNFICPTKLIAAKRNLQVITSLVNS